MFKKFISCLLILAFLQPLRLEAAEPKHATLMVLYDLDATDLTFCKLIGQNGSSYGGFIVGDSEIETSGSSATTTEVTDTDPFDLLSAKDVIAVDTRDGTTLLRSILAKASASSITVSSAWNLDVDGGYNFRWKKSVCGTGASDGWVDVAGAETVTLVVQIDQLNVTGGIDVQMQCKDQAPDSQPNQVFPTCTSGACNTYQNYTTAGIASRSKMVLDEPWAACRVGVKINTADDGGDLTTNAENITAYVVLD
jgi:hypothetical protein